MEGDLIHIYCIFGFKSLTIDIPGYSADDIDTKGLFMLIQFTFLGSTRILPLYMPVCNFYSFLLCFDTERIYK